MPGTRHGLHFPRASRSALSPGYTNAQARDSKVRHCPPREPCRPAVENLIHASPDRVGDAVAQAYWRKTAQSDVHFGSDHGSPRAVDLEAHALGDNEVAKHAPESPREAADHHLEEPA